MAYVQIPNLPLTTFLNSTEQLEIVQAGTSYRTTIAAIIAYINTTQFSGLPTTLPSTPNTLWNNGGVISIT